MSTTEIVEIRYGDERIPVTVSYGDRKRLRIRVHPDRSVTAVAPQNRTRSEVEQSLKKSARWISRQRNYFDRFRPLQPDREYVGGETHLYLGRRYRLKIRGLDELQNLPGHSKRTEPKETVKLTRGFFYVYQQDPTDSAQTERLVWNWYRDHASKLFRRRLTELMPRFLRRGIQEPPLNIRRMKKRWGSCTPSKAILLNTELIKAPTHCIDYVIVHELCHLAHPFHDKGFYRLLDLMMPDWKARKERLEKVDI